MWCHRCCTCFQSDTPIVFFCDRSTGRPGGCHDHPGRSFRCSWGILHVWSTRSTKWHRHTSRHETRILTHPLCVIAKFHHSHPCEMMLITGHRGQSPLWRHVCTQMHLLNIVVPSLRLVEASQGRRTHLCFWFVGLFLCMLIRAGAYRENGYICPHELRCTNFGSYLSLSLPQNSIT